MLLVVPEIFMIVAMIVAALRNRAPDEGQIKRVILKGTGLRLEWYKQPTQARRVTWPADIGSHGVDRRDADPAFTRH